MFHMEPSKAEKILSPFGLKTKMTDTMQAVELFTDTSQYTDLIKILTDLKVDFSEFKEETYSTKELAESEFLRMIPNAYCGYPQPEMDGSFREVSYDLNSACSQCSQGKLQKAPLRILLPKMGKNDISGIHWVYEYVITQRLKELIEKEGFTGYEFWPLINHKTGKPFEDFYQLFFAETMPPMSKGAKIVPAPGVKQCDCGKKGYMLKETPVYERSTIALVKDFNKTFEWVGGGETTWQLPIISKRVYDFLKKNQVKGVWFIPVKVIG